MLASVDEGAHALIKGSCNTNACLEHGMELTRAGLVGQHAIYSTKDVFFMWLDFGI